MLHLLLSLSLALSERSCDLASQHIHAAAVCKLRKRPTFICRFVFNNLEKMYSEGTKPDGREGANKERERG